MTEEKVILKDRIQVYLSPEAKEALEYLMGKDGKPSPTINQVLIDAKRNKQN